MKTCFKTKLIPLKLQFFAEGDGGDDGKQKQDDTDKNQDKNKNESNIDLDATKKQGVAEFLKSLGVSTEEDLSSIVKKYQEDETKNLTDIERVTKERDTAVKELAEERKARTLAEARFEAVKLGAKPMLAEDLVTVAMAKVTKEKDIKAVMEEIKKGTTGNIYFSSDDEEQKKNEKKKGVYTRKTEKSDELNKTDDNEKDEEGKHENSIASRLLAKKKKTAKSSYWD